MSIQYSDPKFDLRTLPRSLREGKITVKEVDQYRKNLPDETKKAKEIVVWQEAVTTPRKSASKTPTFAPANEP